MVGAGDMDQIPGVRVNVCLDNGPTASVSPFHTKNSHKSRSFGAQAEENALPCVVLRVTAETMLRVERVAIAVFLQGGSSG